MSVFVFVAFAAAQQLMQLNLLSTQSEGKCLDGTPAGYYIRANSNESRFVLYFEGGGWCYDLNDCKGRSNTTLGSSKSWPKMMNPWGIMSSSTMQNPYFSGWNAVFFPYCDGKRSLLLFFKWKV